MSHLIQSFVPGEGISREVITADIQRYLGPDAIVRPGPSRGGSEGNRGYLVTAYRTLSVNMIEDLKKDTERWKQEQEQTVDENSVLCPDTTISNIPADSNFLVAYYQSQTYMSRQQYGPTLDSTEKCYSLDSATRQTTADYALSGNGTGAEHRDQNPWPRDYTTREYPQTRPNAFSTSNSGSSPVWISAWPEERSHAYGAHTYSAHTFSHSGGYYPPYEDPYTRTESYGHTRYVGRENPLATRKT